MKKPNRVRQQNKTASASAQQKPGSRPKRAIVSCREIKVVTVREEPLPAGDPGLIDSPERFVSFWQSTIARSAWYHQDKELLVTLCLDAKRRAKSFSLISMGTLNETIAHPREIFRPAIVDAAHSIIVAHNHPSGDPSPSRLDLSLTRRLCLAADLLQIPLDDHIIVGDGDGAYFSFLEVAGLWPEMRRDVGELRRIIELKFEPRARRPPKKPAGARSSEGNSA